MAYFPDLSPYAYGLESHLGVVHVGWLTKTHLHPEGHVEARLIQKIKLLASRPMRLSRGRHICELCSEPPIDLVKTYLPNGIVVDPNCSWARWIGERSGNGEIWVSREKITYAAPVLIAHYIEEHGYLPPEQFLKAIDEAPSI